MSEIERTKTIIVLGTASGVGKSILATGICRILRQDGYRVAPFKASNVSLNSGVTRDGGEMARSQIVQAEAAGIEPNVDMNPILLKETEGASQYIVRGRPVRPEEIGHFYGRRWEIITESLDRVRTGHQVVVIEGSGSPSEINLMGRDVANLRVAKYAKSPIVLVANIDPQGAFAALVGTVAIIRRYDPEAAKLIKAFVINKYRGEREFLEPGLTELTAMTDIPVLGVMPFMKDHGIADEDSYGIEGKDIKNRDAVLDAVVINTPSLQNSDDFNPLVKTPGLQVRFVSDPKEFKQPDIVILGGSKNTVADLNWLRERGIDRLLLNHADNGKTIIGICGGFQMLGEKILDPEGVESSQPVVEGLGLLPVVTKFEKGREKITQQVQGEITEAQGFLQTTNGMQITGYEIHMARTEKTDGSPISSITSSTEQKVAGTYFHGVFRNDDLRRVILEKVAQAKGVTLPEAHIVEPGVEYDRLADIIREHIDINLFYQIIGLRKPMTVSERHMHDLFWHSYSAGMARF